MNQSCAVKWLLETERGRCALREALCWLPDDLEEEFLQRWRPAYVLVKLYRDGEVEVFGPPCVCPKVIRPGRLVTFSEHEIAREKAIDQSLPEPYRAVNFPSNKRLTSLKDLLDV